MTTSPPTILPAILLVEDDASLQASLRGFLEESGFRILVASSKRDAADIIRRERPTLCLLDLNLPDGSGLDLLRRLATQQENIRVIVMTAMPLAHLWPGDARNVLAGWLTKPVPPETLLESINDALAVRQQSQQVEG